MPSWINKLKNRWNLNNGWQVIVILVVFACTGTTVVLIKRPLLDYWFPDGEKPLWANVTYYLLILPVYNIMLLAYGFVFGQFRFFWAFEKRFFSRIFTKFRNTQSKN